MKQLNYTPPMVEIFVMNKVLNLFLDGSPAGIYGPDRGDDLDDPNQDYKQD